MVTHHPGYLPCGTAIKTMPRNKGSRMAHEFFGPIKPDGGWRSGATLTEMRKIRPEKTCARHVARLCGIALTLFRMIQITFSG